MAEFEYGPDDAERWVAEPAGRSDRTPYARDRARVLHSAGLRRLGAKTQVIGPVTEGFQDFHRTRLTHTLEVAQVGRELGQALGCDPDIVDAACLAHDLGHPPFGHNGEAALDTAAESIGGFEGNAQTLRLLTRLEAKTPGAGLNLTRAVLDAASKYPWPLTADAPRDRGGPRLKYGVYTDDLPAFEWMREPAPASTLCMEAQVMDFADDVAYSVHDVEDGVVSRAIDLEALDNAAVWETVRDWYLPEASDHDLEGAYERLRSFGYWPNGPYRATRAMHAALKDLTSQLIGRFCTSVVGATRQAYGPGALTRYAANLAVPESTRLEIAVLKGIAARYVMRTPVHVRLLTEQHDILRELVDSLSVTAPIGLEPEFRADFEAVGGDPERLRVIVDQVASLTDTSAVAMHTRLCGGPSPIRIAGGAGS